MGEKENAALIERIWTSIENDLSALEDGLADDCVQEWPQSGERVVGKANIIAINRNYPGLPTATVRRIVAEGSMVVSELELMYGSKRYDAVSIFEFQGDKIVKETDYFAEPFEAPSWRAQWVERF